MLIQRQTAISANLVQLAAFLRNHGFVVGPREETDAMKALTGITVSNKGLFKSALKSVFAKSKWQYEQFDDLYEDFQDQLKKAVESKVKQQPESRDKPVPQAPPTVEALKSWLFNEDTDEERDISTYSNIEVLTKKNFDDMSEDELRLINALLKRIARQLAHQKSRLTKRSKLRNQLDLKRTASDTMRRGGDTLRFYFSEPKNKKLRIVLLCDVSKSMSLYSRFFVHLIYAFQHAYDKIDTYVFSTALHRVTDLLDNYSFESAFDKISDRVPQWSGGTRIGNSIQKYVSSYGHGTLTRKTIVFIISDGWDTGDSEGLASGMRQIHKKSRKVIWLNPLAGSPSFSPEVTGLKAALPYVDVMESAHNLESLKRAMRHLKTGRRNRYNHQITS